MNALDRITDYIKDLQERATPLSDAYTMLNLVRHKVILTGLEEDRRRKESGMYILLEKRDAQGGETLDEFDAMGIAYGGKDAAEWEQKNPRYRRTIYCPEKVEGIGKEEPWTL